jgi:hypothetical protein
LYCWLLAIPSSPSDASTPTSHRASQTGNDGSNQSEPHNGPRAVSDPPTVPGRRPFRLAGVHWPGGSNGLPRGARSAMSRHGLLRVYKHALVRVADPVASLPYTPRRVLAALRDGEPQTVEQVRERLRGRTPRSATVLVALNHLRAAGLAAEDQTGRWAACDPPGQDDLLGQLRLRGPHDLRHTFATWLEDAGVPVRVIDERWVTLAGGVLGERTLLGEPDRHPLALDDAGDDGARGGRDRATVGCFVRGCCPRSQPGPLRTGGSGRGRREPVALSLSSGASPCLPAASSSWVRAA